jgi:N-acetylneuraminic acid mutarotase
VRQDYRNTVQVYDPRADAWHSGGTLPVATLSAVSAVIDGRVHLVGGGVPTYQTSDQHLIYDPTRHQFERAAPYPHLMEAGGGGTFGSTLCVFGGRIATPGRRNAPFPDGSCYAAGRWQPILPMPTPRAEVAYLTMGGAIYAIGGDGDAGPMPSVERLVMRRPIA